MVRGATGPQSRLMQFVRRGVSIVPALALLALASSVPGPFASTQLGQVAAQTVGDPAGDTTGTPAAKNGTDMTVEAPAWQRAFRVASLNQMPRELSNDCRVGQGRYMRKASLKRILAGLREDRQVKVLAIGSSSTVGIGASSQLNTYPVRLEATLEGYLKNVNVEVVTRGVGGEVAVDAAERIKLEVADHRPEVVVWQVGTNDAMARVDDGLFREQLTRTITWLKSHRIDVILIDPQYVEHLAQDEHYRTIVRTIAEVASLHRVLVVNRFDAMADLAARQGNGTYLAPDHLHLNDLGYKCMAEYAARAIVAGILQAEGEQQPARGPTISPVTPAN